MAKKTRAAPVEAASSGESDSESSSDDDSSVRVEENEQSVDQGNLSSKKRKMNEESENESDSDSDDSDSDADSSDDDSENEEVEGKDEEGDYNEEIGSEDYRNASDDVVLPLHERLKLKEDQGLSLRGVRARKSRALEVASERLAKFNNQKAGDDDDETQSKKKKSKHAPTEVSSKRSDFFKRGAINLNESGIGVEIGAHRYKPMDPRVSSLSGHLNEEQFEQNFAFVEEIRNKEIAQLKKRIQARKVSGKKGQQMRKRLKISGGSLEEDQEQLHTMVGEKSEIQRRKINRAAKQSVKKKMREEVVDGKHGAYFLKRKEKKRMELEAKFEVIRNTGGDKAVDKMLAKKRRKNKSRDAGLMGK
jgi:ribosomal RNA-processing protein 36